MLSGRLVRSGHLPDTISLRHQYALAIGLVALMIVTRWLLSPILGDLLPFTPVSAVLLPLVMLVRPGPFLVAALLGWLVSLWLFGMPHLSGTPHATSLTAALVVVMAIGAAGLAAWYSGKASDFRRRALVELKQGEARLRATFESAAVGIAHVGLDGRWLQFNDCLCRILGQPRHELLKKTFADVTHLDDIKEDMTQANRVLRGEIDSYSLEKRYIREDGSPVHALLTVSLVRDHHGEPLYFVAVVSDLSERKRAEAQREAAMAAEMAGRAKFEAALESMTDPIFITDAKGNFLDFNEAFVSFHNFKDKSECRTTLAEYPDVLEICNPDGSEVPLEMWPIPRALRGERRSNMEYQMRRKDIDYAWMASFSFAPIRDQRGTITGAVVTGRDITAHKRREMNSSFLAGIGEDFARLATPRELIDVLGVKLSAFLRCEAICLCQLGSPYQPTVENLSWHKHGGVGLCSALHFNDCFTTGFFGAQRVGELVIIHDTQNDPRTQAAPCAAIGLHSLLGIPYHSRGGLAFFALTDRRPRTWQAHEVDLFREVANRIFPRLERASAEEALRQSEQKYRTLYSEIDEGFCIIKLFYDGEGNAHDYQFIEVNPAFAKHTGLHDAQGRRVSELVPGQDPLWIATYSDVARTGRSIRFQNRSHEMHRFFDVYAFRIGDPDEHLVAVLFHDITQRVKIEEDLRASERRLGLALDAAQAAAWEVDLASQVHFWDERFQRLLQIPPAQVADVQERWTEFIVPEDRDRAMAEFAAACVEDAPPYDSTFRALRMDGQERWYHSRGIVERHSDSARMLGVIQDITAHKHAEDALREADRRKDEFLAILSHELRNPLAPIRTGVHLLEVAYDEPATRQIVPVLTRQVEHITRLLDDLLHVSRIIRGQIDLRMQHTELAGAIQIAMDACAPLIQSKGHQLRVNLPETPVMLHADPDRLAQMFSNLLNNAAKYMEPGGTIELAATRHTHEVCISIKDQGIGIPSANIDSVFDMFFQVGTNRHQHRDGLGIGLSLVKRLAELHGGSVSARSAGPGQGSEFLVRLPAIVHTPASNAPAATAGHPPAATGTRRKILVVDDNKDAAECVAMLLNLSGNEAHTATSGPQALDLASRFAPSIVLLDLGMPGMDGFEVCRRLRQLPNGQKTTIIAVTGWGQDEDRRKTQAAGFDAHLVKPLALDQLVAAIDGKTPTR